MKKRKIPKIITSIYASNTLLLALTTSSIAKIGDIPKHYSQLDKDPKLLLQKQEEGEKVTVRSQGKNLIFTVAGKANRYCTVVYRTEDMKANEYVLLPDTKTNIGLSGTTTITVNMSNLLDKKVQLILLTSDRESFGLDTDIRGTSPFEVMMSSKEVREIRGLQRMTEKGAAVTMAASALSREKR